MLLVVKTVGAPATGVHGEATGMGGKLQEWEGEDPAFDKAQKVDDVRCCKSSLHCCTDAKRGCQEVEVAL